MGLFDFFKKGDEPVSISEVKPTNSPDPEVKNWGDWNPIYYDNFDGEKNPGEIGRIKKYRLDYVGLRARSWQSFLTSDVTQDVIKKFSLWVVGIGLKIQSEPLDTVLKAHGVTMSNREEFTRQVEEHYKLFVEDKVADFHNQDDLHSLAFETYKGAIVGGDMLVVHYIKNGVVKTRVIDGELVINPPLTSKFYKRKNVRHGVELNDNNEHIAYFVKTTDGKVTRIPAIGKTTGRRFAYLVYGLKYRVDSVRGLPLIAAVMETIKKMDRYKEATVGSAEERQKIVYAIEHKEYSTGENVLQKNIAASFNANEKVEKVDDAALEKTATKVAETTTRQAFNMPLGASMKALESKNELYFEDFFNANVNLVCATIGIPPEVAMSKYDSNFSSARAALKDWEHTMKFYRNGFSKQFYKTHFEFWFDLAVSAGIVTAPGYLEALAKDDFYIVRAYRRARFIGANVPHIDPLKEVQAERAKLGDLGGSLPLTTGEQATENLSEGDFQSNAQQFKDEIKDFPVVQKSQSPGGEPNKDDDEEDDKD